MSSTTRARWSDDEKKAVLDSYNLATDADDFFRILTANMPQPYHRRTVKAYLTHLNEVLVPKTDPRRPVYQSLCDANQKELQELRVVAQIQSDLIQASDAMVLRYGNATNLDEMNKVSADWLWALNDLRNRVDKGNFSTGHTKTLRDDLAVATEKVALAVTRATEFISNPVQVPVTPTPSFAPPDAFDWVFKEVDVVPRVPPGRATPPSLFRDPTLPTLTEALAQKDAADAASEAKEEGSVTKSTLAASMVAPVRGAGPRVTSEPKALTPRHYPQLPAKSALTVDEFAKVFSLDRNKVSDAITYGFLPSLGGSSVTYHAAQKIHNAMSEGHSFAEACRIVNPSSTGILPMKALFEPPPVSGGYVPSVETVEVPLKEEQFPVVVPGHEAGRVNLTDGSWTVSGGPMNPRSISKMSKDLQATSGAPLEVTVPASPPKSVEAPSAPFTGHVEYTLEAVRDGVLTIAQAMDILHPIDTRKAAWALGLLTASKITVTQCDRLLFAK